MEEVIRARALERRYWFYDKEPGLAGSIRSLFAPRKKHVQAVRDLDLSVGLGEVVGFLGPNGAGKTTTLKMLCGILHPSDGELFVLGRTPARREKEFLRRITYVAGQRNRLFWDLPAEDYFDFCRVVYEIPRDVFRRTRDEVVELAGIGDLLRVPQRKLSAGERKRCEIAAALLHDPRLILLDEPTNALDLVNAGRIRRFIREKSRDSRRTFLVTSHNMSDISGVCGRAVVIDGGAKVYDGPVSELTRGRGRRVTVTFGGPWSLEAVRTLGKVISATGDSVTLEVAPDEAASAARRLLDSYPVTDIGVAEPSLEAVIEELYRQGPARGPGARP